MLAHLKLSPFLLTKLHAAVLVHWPAANPASPLHTSHISQDAMSFLSWLLSHGTEVGSPYAYLRVKMKSPTLVLTDTGVFQPEWSDIHLEYTHGLKNPLFTVSGQLGSYRLPISIADLQLPHEFAKRLTELKALLEERQAA